MMRRREAYEMAVETLTSYGIEEAKSDAMILLEELCHITRNDIYAHGEEEIPQELTTQLLEALTKRKQHIPVSQIIGKQEFMGLSFCVNEYVLTPRQDTEILVEEVLKELQDGYKILDMCTGSGCILLSLLHYSNHCTGTGVDISPQALQVAEENAKKLGLEADWIESNLFEKVIGKYDLIVSNPPYIRTDIIPTLMEEVREHEPVLALDGKEDGCYFYRQIIEKSTEYLNGGGMLFFEIGYDQGEAVSNMMREKGYCEVKVVKDYAGLDRVVLGTYCGGKINV